MPRGVPLDLVGETFGKWTVKAKSHKRDTSGTVLWECVCECGAVAMIPTGNLRGGYSTGCRQCGAKAAGKKRETHGETYTKIWSVWRNRVKHDCVPEWEDYKTFKQDVLPKTDKNLLKIDEDLPFGPDNFRWSSGLPPRIELQEVAGVRMSQADWGEKLGLTRERVRQLVESFGTLEAALQYRAEAVSLSLSELIEVHSTLDFHSILCSRNGGRPVKYPWDEWADGRIHEIRAGREVDCIDVARGSILSYARKAGKKAWTRVDPDDKKVLMFRIGRKD